MSKLKIRMGSISIRVCCFGVWNAFVICHSVFFRDLTFVIRHCFARRTLRPCFERSIKLFPRALRSLIETWQSERQPFQYEFASGKTRSVVRNLLTNRKGTESTARQSRNQRSADSLVRESRPAGKEHADKAVRAPRKSSQREKIWTSCGAQ